MPKRKKIYTSISNDILLFRNKRVLVSQHALIRARERRIGPDHIEKTILCGKIKEFAKNQFRITGKNIECVCEEVGENIIIKTVVRI